MPRRHRNLSKVRVRNPQPRSSLSKLLNPLRRKWSDYIPPERREQ